MVPFDSLLFGGLQNKQAFYSKGEILGPDIGTPGKLPRLFQEDGPPNKINTTDHIESQNNFHNLDALFLDTTSQFRSYDQMQELADIESQYSELIKPHAQAKGIETSSHDAVHYEVSERKLSTDAIIRLGGERFIQSSSSSSVNDISMPSHPYSTSFSGLSDQEVKDVELIENLLLSAEKVTQQQFERSTKLLDWCDVLSPSLGNPIQRLVHYFSKSLREKIDGETGRVSVRGSGKKQVDEIEARMMSPNPTTISVYQSLPFFQAGHFSGVQSLVDGVAGATHVHIIDLSIKHGIHGTILMQALKSQHNCPIKHLKITAVGNNHKQKIEHTGDRLKNFAESINLSFTFHVVVVEDMLDFKKELFELDPDEALAVHSSHGLWSMISHQDRLESLMKGIKSFNPRVMVVSEAVANLNSPNFVNRFIEALFFYGALFDSLEDCMGREDENRVIAESMYFGRGIRSCVAAEGEERAIRHVNLDVWRKFFARFGMKEIELSMSALYQANLMAEKLPCGSSCSLDMDGNSLLIGWKGTPIQCVSAWTFS
uniref:scarecrow-like protein 18 n=1 Tax=Erigeron canadensis TaxID=72917 RepID=UPI001CB90F1A|nr:scarecrow-like protein 18 [Erigeron canadensis]